MSAIMPFTDRLYYCATLDGIAHLQYLTSGVWAIQLLTNASGWEVVDIVPTYTEAFDRIRGWQPDLLLEEAW